MEFLKYIFFTIKAAVIVTGIIPFIIILLATTLVIPYIFYAKKTAAYINKNKDNKKIYITGIISIIIPLLMCAFTYFFNNTNSDSWYDNLSALGNIIVIGPSLAIADIICMYLCFNKNRYQRTVISDIKNSKSFIKEKKIYIEIGIIIILLYGLIRYSYENYYSIISDKLPVKYDKIYHANSQNKIIQFQKGNIIEDSYKEEDEPDETTIYNYVYDNKTKEIKFFKNKKYVFSNTVIYADENMIILKTKNNDIEVWSPKKIKNNFLDNYKTESNIDVSGYYLYDDNTELYLSKDNKIYFGTQEGIKTGTYEVLEFKIKELSNPVINYTLEGKNKLGNTHDIKYYNDTSMYIKDINNKEIIKCTKENISCAPDERDKILKKIDQSNLKYLKNIK